METPDAFTQPEAVPEPKSRGKTCLVVGLVLLVVAGLLCAGLCGGLFLVGVWGIKQLPPYQMALEQVQQAPEVIERLGEPIEDATRMPQIQQSQQDGQGSATIDFDVEGPNGKAHVRTQARMIDGAWGLTLVEVTFADGQRISLGTGDDGTEDAPKWTPPEEGPQAPGADVAPPQLNLELPDNVPIPET